MPFSSYMARVADRVSWPQPDGGNDSGTADSKLEALKAALTQIDAYGVQGAESVDEAQVRVLTCWWCSRCSYNKQMLSKIDSLLFGPHLRSCTLSSRSGRSSESGNSVIILCTTRAQSSTGKRRQKQLRRRISSVQTRCWACVTMLMYLGVLRSCLCLW